MTIYLIRSPVPNANLAKKIESIFRDNWLILSEREWLVSTEGTTTKDICDKLGVTDGSIGNAIVFATSGYFGRAETSIWEWMKAKLEKPANG